MMKVMWARWQSNCTTLLLPKGFLLMVFLFQGSKLASEWLCCSSYARDNYNYWVSLRFMSKVCYCILISVVLFPFVVYTGSLKNSLQLERVSQIKMLKIIQEKLLPVGSYGSVLSHDTKLSDDTLCSREQPLYDLCSQSVELSLFPTYFWVALRSLV